ncbi:MAG: glutamyl-tRNA reductase, partial [Chromatiales bacterium]|nr:glutamyl-tRNA reductase [Chromatiales bacterium]
MGREFGENRAAWHYNSGLNRLGLQLLAMNLFAFGINHTTAPVAMRERVGFTPDKLPHALRDLVTCPDVAEAAILSTCNRTDLYCGLRQGRGEDAIRWFQDYHRISPDEVRPHLYMHHAESAVRHIIRVASGLDSMILGEPQIFGQVKSAFATASSERCTGSLLNKLFMSSFAVGKKVRAETGLGEGAVSVSYAAISLARKIFGNLRERRVLVVGAGDMAELTALHLQSQQVAQIVVTNRTLARAEALARKVGGT